MHSASSMDNYYYCYGLWHYHC